MALVNMDFNGRSVPAKIAKGRLFVSNLMGNPDFPTPNPPLSVLISATAALEAAYNAAQDGSRIHKQAMKEAEEKMDALVSTLGAYIQTTSMGDDAKILSSGALVRKESVPLGILPAPVEVLAKIGTEEGTVEVRWKRVQGAKGYIIEMATDLGATKWTFFGASTSAKFTATGLTSGKKYMFRVAALGAAGMSPQSDPAIGMAS